MPLGRGVVTRLGNLEEYLEVEQELIDFVDKYEKKEVEEVYQSRLRAFERAVECRYCREVATIYYARWGLCLKHYNLFRRWENEITEI